MICKEAKFDIQVFVFDGIVEGFDKICLFNRNLIFVVLVLA